MLIGLTSWLEETIGFLLPYIFFGHYDYVKIAFFLLCSYGRGAYKFYDQNQQYIDVFVKATGPSPYNYIMVKESTNKIHELCRQDSLIGAGLDKITCVTVVEEKKENKSPISAIVQTLEDKTDSNGSIQNEEQAEPLALDEIECKIEET